MCLSVLFSSAQLFTKQIMSSRFLWRETIVEDPRPNHLIKSERSNSVKNNIDPNKAQLSSTLYCVLVCYVFCVTSTSFLRGYFKIGSLSTSVFETRTATGSELFSLLTCPHTATFTLLSIFSPLETSSIKIWGK